MELPLNPSTIETKTNANDRIEQLILKILKWQFLNLNQTPIRSCPLNHNVVCAGIHAWCWFPRCESYISILYIK